VGEIDNATWQALGLTLTVLGLVASFLLWRRRGAASGLRAAAWSLLPLAAGLTGTLRLLWEVADSVATWATRLVFSPVVWLGIVLTGVSVVLFVVSGVLRRRTPSRRAVSGTPAPERGRPAVSGDDDMADIEALLKKHGIA
jgi:hypothetical protein